MIEGEVLVVVLEAGLSTNQMAEVIEKIRAMEDVDKVKTLSRVLFDAFPEAAEAHPSQEEALDGESAKWEKLVRTAADGLYAEGKACEGKDEGRAMELKVISSNLHRLCQIAKGEEPLPAPGSRL